MKMATAHSRQTNIPEAFSQYKAAKSTFQQKAKEAKAQTFREFTSSLDGTNMWTAYKKISKC